jgi:hypothetical protein
MHLKESLVPAVITAVVLWVLLMFESKCVYNAQTGGGCSVNADVIFVVPIVSFIIILMTSFLMNRKK